MGSETGEEVGVQNIDLNSDSSQLKVVLDIQKRNSFSGRVIEKNLFLFVNG